MHSLQKLTLANNNVWAKNYQIIVITFTVTLCVKITSVGKALFCKKIKRELNFSKLIFFPLHIKGHDLGKKCFLFMTSSHESLESNLPIFSLCNGYFSIKLGNFNVNALFSYATNTQAYQQKSNNKDKKFGGIDSCGQFYQHLVSAFA
jgi:hypothetical protein